ncbi:MAG: hypothetical protein N3F04_01785 [Candidatus Nezhaarchaeota archaeon]|nr:hypothetical protein [Candidatus Nezhaarchaeota archaeon]MCX8141508.1 hypothetical protein [Candidatus Nezhaarchaeota archaeon]MDW8049775.1 hypothetical protein [Nitrososphaerota archaeon]
MNFVKLHFKVDDVRDYNLDLTLKPSFVSALYSKEEELYWVKCAGLYADALSLKQRGGSLEVCVEREVDNKVYEAILCESGLWDEKPSSRISRLSGALMEQVKALSELFPGVRLSIAPHDFNCVFMTVILSKRTNYEVFVRKWVKMLWSRWRCRLDIIASLQPDDIKTIATSYQLVDLVRVLRDYVRASRRDEGVEETRRLLMSCWGIGPKIADATLLFTTKSPWIVPCDTHLQRVSKRLGWIENDTRLPTKSLCLTYYCDECVDKYGSCLSTVIKELFPGFGGWVQTMIYLFGSSICTSRKPKCSLCHPTLREYCREARKQLM